MSTIEKLNDILDISGLPEKIILKEGWDVAFVLSEIDDVKNTGYISSNVIDLLCEYFGTSRVHLCDSEPTSKNNFNFVCFSEEKHSFHKDLIDIFFDETGLWGFVAEFKKDGTFVVGLDQEYVIILSPHERGFITHFGGVNRFEKICDVIFQTGTNSMDREIYHSMFKTIYNK